LNIFFAIMMRVFWLVFYFLAGWLCATVIPRSPALSYWELQIALEDEATKVFYTTGMQPKYPGDSCLDLRVSQNVTVTHDRFVVPYGVRLTLYRVFAQMRLPSSYFIVPRSNLSRSPFVLVPAVGVIDAGFRGVLDSILSFSYGWDAACSFTIPAGTAFAQLCTYDLQFPHIRIVDSLPASERGDRGRGSSGNTDAYPELTSPARPVLRNCQVEKSDA
jgi:dUTPase